MIGRASRGPPALPRIRGYSLRGEPPDDASDHRLAGDRHRGLRADLGEWQEPRAETGREHDCLANRRLRHNRAYKAIVRPARVNARRRNTYMVKHSMAKAGKPK